jgi:NADH-quinone oxidoreductase subunit M
MTVSFLLFLPLLAALALFFIKSNAVKNIALLFSLVELVLGIYMLTQYNPQGGLQFTTEAAWMPKLGIYFTAAVDGINIIPIILSVLLVPIIIATTFKHEYKNASAFYALIMFMQFGLLLVFTALDGFLFYVGWEVALIPIYSRFSSILLPGRYLCCWRLFICTCKLLSIHLIFLNFTHST